MDLSNSINPRLGAAPWPGRFHGRVILVTGGAGGLGGSATERLRAEGAIVVKTDIAIAEDRLEDDHAELALDVTDPERWAQVVATVVERYGRIDGLLMGHGSQGPEALVEDVPREGWTRTLNINLDSCFYGLQAVMPTMKAQRYGRIAVLSSIAGREGNASMTAYSVSKAGVIALVKSVAKEVAPEGIVVNAVAPSMFDTPLLAHLSPERNAMLLSRVPMGRVGYPPEFAALAAWLLSPECSYTTGQTLDLTGGRYSGA
ncbi:SDR family oxidoreductase [Salinibacterium sp. SYSU T00001]|uniref:SDR family NAD(P)-dependent oxidoreductase n=1 Tax=Homoserinimonas sedimenticola TaxID=2986805 RepID=UPI002235B7BF|nr:SDR family NAD(P)-dependent oxidoreductase [Salinibacterium sedimenticola]MCW4385488.1 SDR family oxidoreductase [Salinibacterium sedimenticola]